MNERNETLASPEMMKQLREADLHHDYKPVPRGLEKEARRVLAGRHIANFDRGFKSQLKKTRTALGNARHENALLKAKEKLRAEGLLK